MYLQIPFEKLVSINSVNHEIALVSRFFQNYEFWIINGNLLNELIAYGEKYKYLIIFSPKSLIVREHVKRGETDES